MHGLDLLVRFLPTYLPQVRFFMLTWILLSRDKNTTL